MGQASDSKRNAALDEKKSRAAGRRGRTGQENEAEEAIIDAEDAKPMKGKTAGAFGASAKANRKGGVQTQGGGGGGGAQSPAKDSALSTPRSSRPARKRKA